MTILKMQIQETSVGPFLHIQYGKSKMRRPAITSPQEAVRLAQGAGRTIDPPSHIWLDTADLKHFEAVIAQKAKADWTPHEIDLAAMLARTMRRHVVEQEALDAEGYVIEGEHGPKANPRARAVKALADMILSFRRSLSIHGRAQMPDARDAAKRNAIGRESEADCDELLARPH